MNAEQVIKNFYASSNSADIKKATLMFDKDAVYEDTVSGVTIEGLKNIEECNKGFFSAFKNARIELKDLFVTNDHACAEWIMSGIYSGSIAAATHSSAGRSFKIRGVSVFTIKGEKISHESVYFNQMHLLKQLGVIPDMRAAG